MDLGDPFRDGEAEAVAGGLDAGSRGVDPEKPIEDTLVKCRLDADPAIFHRG